MKMLDLTNQRFGRLVAIEPTNRRVDSKVVWRCKCDCGKEHFCVGRELKLGHTKSCGCLRKEMLQNGLVKLESGFSSFNQLYGNYARQARIRGYDFLLTRDQFHSITSQNCYYCGTIPLQEQKVKSGNGTYIYNGIDRVDNTKGYTLDNSVPCCGVCNRAKDEMTRDEFLSWIERVYSRSLNVGT